MKVYVYLNDTHDIKENKENTINKESQFCKPKIRK